MKITSTKSISFPKIPFAISADTVVELPTTLTKEEKERILSEPDISVVKEAGSASKPTEDA